MEKFIVAVDGPAGSGKSTIAKILAKKYGLTYLDTGAMYRMATLYILRKGKASSDRESIVSLLGEMHLDIQGDRFILNGEDVSETIRTPEVAANVSAVSAVKEVREKLVQLQREISLGKKVILDGRDIGTVVFPNADLKVFLVASPEERAKRRLKEFEAKNIPTDYEEVLAAIKERDHIDSTRAESPLKKAEDAVEIDTSFMTKDEVVEAISLLIDEKTGA